MKKSIIALAVATASMASVAQADTTTLYGSLRAAVTFNEDSAAVVDPTSRWGVRGSEDLGNGLEAIYRFEYRLNTSNGTDLSNNGRLAFVGLTGGFGTLTIGQQWSPYDSVFAAADIFNNVFYSLGSDNDYGRIGSSVQYFSPDLGGFQLRALVSADGEGGNDDYVDFYNISATFNIAGFGVGLTYAATDDSTDQGDVAAASLTYGNDAFNATFVATHDLEDGAGEEITTFYLAGQYNITDSDNIRLGLSTQLLDSDTQDDPFNAAIGYEHKFTSRTKVWAEYNYVDIDGEDDENTVSLGLRTDF